jgi:tetratricopeptide (TPR) repeat protein
MGTSSLPEENSQMVATVAVSTTPANALNPAAAAALKSSETYHVRIIAAVHNSIGLLRAEAKDFVRAADQFRQVRKWNPGQEGLDYNLGLAYFRLELYKDAVQVLENAVRVDQGNTQARWLLGMSYFRTRVFSKVPGLLADVPAASTNVDLCYALASSLIREGKPDLADPAIQRIATLVDNSPTLHVVRGQQHFARGDIERAREELTVGLSINRQEPQAHYFLGLIYLKKQMVAEALKEFEAELLLNPNNVEARYQLGLTLLVSRDNSRGIQTMREVVKVDPDFPGARYELGKALLEQEEIPAAVENLEIAAKLDPENALVHFELSRAYFAAGRREEGKRESDIFNRLKKATGSQTAP